MSVNSNPNIIFYFPYRGAGGVSVLFLELAKLLAPNYNVFLVDFKDGYMGSRIPLDVNFIDIEEVKQYPTNSIVILQSLPFWRITDFHKFSYSTRFFYWNLHPKNFCSITLPKNNSLIKKLVFTPIAITERLYKKKYGECLNYFSSNDALFFMDFENYRSTQEIYPKVFVKEKYLPCFINAPKMLPIIDNVKETFNFCWIGRIVDFKAHILVHTLMRLNKVDLTKINFKFYIVGDGDHLLFLKEQIDKFQLNFEVVFIGDLTLEEMEDFINNKCDLLFAMGLSSLEGASRKIPTILLDYSYSPIEGLYKFKYIYQQSNYNLTSEICKGSLEINSTFESEIEQFKENRDRIGENCYEYWLINHSGAKTLEVFKKAIIECQATKRGIIKLKLNKPDLFSVLYFDVIPFIYSFLRKKTSSLKLHGFRYPNSNF